MKLAYTSDLHVEYHLEVVGLVAERVAALAPDALVLAGDVCPDPSRLERALRIIGRSVSGPVLYLPGNHELWCGGERSPGPNSRQRYEQVLPALARRAGVVPLGQRPVVVGDVTFVGVTGWYDYSLRDPGLEQALGPVDYAGDSQQDVTCVDRLQVFWPDDAGRPLSDVELSAHMVANLRRQLADAGPGPVVVVTHMLPHRRLLEPPGVERSSNPALRYIDAFMGSAELWEEISRSAAVRFVIAGHHHDPVQLLLPTTTGTVPCAVSPVGSPREIVDTLPTHVGARVAVVEIPSNSG